MSMNKELLVPGDLVEVLGWTSLSFLKGVIIRVDTKKIHPKEYEPSPFARDRTSYKNYEILCIKTGKILKYDDLYYTIQKID